MREPTLSTSILEMPVLKKVFYILHHAGGHTLILQASHNFSDKNPLCDEAKIQKRGLYVKREKNHKIWRDFSSHAGETGTKSFRSGMRATQDMTSIPTS
jgi:hypothetical protein